MFNYSKLPEHMQDGMRLYIERGLLYETDGDWGEAAQDFERARALDPQGDSLRDISAVRLRRAVLRRGPVPPPGGRLSRRLPPLGTV